MASRMTITRRGALGLAIGAGAVVGLPLVAQTRPVPVLDEAAIDALVARFMAAFETPGIAVAIVRKDQPAWVKGYGVRTLGRAARVDVHTRFGIASNTKAFTAALLAQLVDEGKVEWDAPVMRYLPEFRMADPAVTQMMTVRDLLVHRSGLPLGAGDLMIFPKSDRPAAEIMKALPELKPARGFRAGYDYDNILYIVAGLLIERVSGQPFQRVMQARLLTPLAMADAVPSVGLLRTDNVAGRHARLGPPVRGMGPMKVVPPDEAPNLDAAGGINASVTDVAKWLEVQLAGGALPDGKRVWSEAQAKEMWTPQTIVRFGDGATAANPSAPVTATYALGWFAQDYRGERLVSHSGGLSGQVTQTAMIPARGIGLVVLSNVEDGVSSGIRNALLDMMIGAPAFDWVSAWRKRADAQNAEALATLGATATAAPEGGPSLPLKAYAGRYRDRWYGDIVVSEQRGRLHIDFLPTPVFKSVLEPWGPDTFRTRFAAEAGEDALVTFATAGDRVTGVTMKAFSPLADFSFDYHDLAFTPVLGR